MNSSSAVFLVINNSSSVHKGIGFSILQQLIYSHSEALPRWSKFKYSLNLYLICTITAVYNDDVICVHGKPMSTAASM